MGIGSQHCDDIQILATEKRELIQQQIEGLLTIQSALDDIIASCQSAPSKNQCALIVALSQKGFLNK